MGLEAEVKAKVAELKRDKNVLGIFIAGSYARGEMHAESDVDMYALVKKPRSSNIYDPYEKLKLGFYTLKQLRSRFTDIDWIFSRPLLLNSKIVYDPKGALKQLRKQVMPYPEAIRQYELRANVQHATMQLARAEYALSHGELQSSAYFAQKCAQEILYYYYVLNRVYLPSERKFWTSTGRIKAGKEAVSRLASIAFPQPDAAALKTALNELSELCRQIEADYSKQAKFWKPKHLKVAKNWF